MKRAQSTLEMTLSLIVLMMLCAGMFRLVGWSVGSMVGRHNAYIGTLPGTFNDPDYQFYNADPANLVPQIDIEQPLVYDSHIADALNLYQNSGALFQGGRNAEFYYNLLTDKEIKILYGPTPGGVDGYWDKGANTIYINAYLAQNAPETAIAAIIAHELTHADYSYNPDFWKQLTKAEHPELADADIHIDAEPYDSIDQEYKAFYNGVKAYEQLRENGTDLMLEIMSAIMSQGEDYAKAYIANSYIDLPDY